MGEGLVYEARLPLRWRTQQGAHGGEAVCSDEANADFLRVLSALEEHGTEHHEETVEIAHELRRLESKLDLVLGMVGQILARQLGLPQPVPVRLGARHLEWTGSPAPLPGERVCIELYLHPEYPRPLLLPGEVEAAEPDPQGTTRVRVRLEPLNEMVQNWLERIIFRHHRRLIAHSRRPPAD